MITLTKSKKLTINVLTASLISAALVAVFSVLRGSFDDTTAKVLWTLLSVVGHALFSLLLISKDEKDNNKLALTQNVIYFLTPVSLLTSGLGIWGVVLPESVRSLYQFYGLIIFATFHIDSLHLLKGASKIIDRLSKSNVFATLAMSAMIVPVIFLSDPRGTLGDFYYRLLASVAIVNGTLTALAIIFFKLYLQKHPELSDNFRVLPKGKHKVWLWVLIVFVVLQVLPMLIFALASLFSSGNSFD